jgi:hypothetical protein
MSPNDTYIQLRPVFLGLEAGHPRDDWQHLGLLQNIASSSPSFWLGLGDSGSASDTHRVDRDNS